jgi:hypothetical protein
MAHSLKSSSPLEVTSGHDSAAAELSNRLSPAIPEPAPEAAGAAHSDPQANLGDSAQFRAGILRRYDAPFKSSWPQDRLHE